MISIAILTENSTAHTPHKTCSSEWGLSLYIATSSYTLLFDTGHTDIFLRNAKALGIDLGKINGITLSHHHWDHTEGLYHFKPKQKRKLYAHPSVFKKIPILLHGHIGKYFDETPTKKPLWLSETIVFLGEIPRTTSFETGIYKDDAMEDDTGIGIKTSNGLIVVAGCSHAGIANICLHAMEV